MNIRRHRRTKFVLKENLNRHIRTPLLEKERLLLSEYDIPIHEVIKKKRTDVDKIPVHVSLFVYQLSKLHFFRFVIILFEFLVPDTFKLCYMAWYNLYMICN